MPSAHRQWKYGATRVRETAEETKEAPSPLRVWEYENTRPWRRWTRELLRRTGGPARRAVPWLVAFVIGAQFASGPDRTAVHLDWSRRITAAETAVLARQGELELARLELHRMRAIMEQSARYGIPADLAAAIHDVALSEGIEPDLAYRLVRTESGFVRTAVSPKGAVGLTQVMPTTAFELEPAIGYRALFDRETNLRLGFRYLGLLLEKYEGDLRLALLAYNRGPGTVDSIRRGGGDPGNGYARAVMSGQ